MVFEVDPDKPNIPAIARILSGMGVLCLIASGICMMLAFSNYEWVTDSYAMIGAIAAFLLALIFVAQAKTIELLAIVSARVRSKFAIESLAKSGTTTSSPAVKPSPLRQPQKERVIHVSEEQARQQGFKLK